MTDGLSEANREPDYSTDPVTGACNACGSIGCSFGCMKRQRDEERVRANVREMHSAMSVAAVISLLRREVRKLRAEIEKYNRGRVNQELAWTTIRELLGIGPKDSVIDALERLVRGGRQDQEAP